MRRADLWPQGEASEEIRALQRRRADLSLLLDQTQIESGLQYFSFVQDPYGSAGSSPVLQIFYPKGSFGGDGGGGAHFYVSSTVSLVQAFKLTFAPSPPPVDGAL